MISDLPLFYRKRAHARPVVGMAYWSVPGGAVSSRFENFDCGTACAAPPFGESMNVRPFNWQADGAAIVRANVVEHQNRAGLACADFRLTSCFGA